MTVDDLVQSLAIEVPGCPTPTIRDMLRWAQRELCDKGNVWLSSDGPVVVAANTPFAEVELPLNAEAIRITKLVDGGRTLTPGEDYVQSGSNGIHFLKLKPESVTMMGEVACMPSYGKDMPASLMSRWSEAIMDGARSRLLILPQAWQNPALSEHYRRSFMDAQAHARSLSIDGYQRGSIRMKVRGII